MPTPFLRGAVVRAVALGLAVLLSPRCASAIGLNLSGVVSFNGSTGDTPFSGVILANDGNLYGTTFYGGSSPLPGSGSGLVYQLKTNGLLSPLALFYGTNGANPYARPLQGSDGYLYGTTSLGGTNGLPNGYGTVYRVSTNGALATLVHFDGTKGASPSGPLILGADGNYYGTTSYGGTNGGKGTVFRMTPAGALTSLFSFNGTNGSNPYSGVMQGQDGALYGTTLLGGTNGNWGTVFRITTNGAFSSLFSFNGTNGANPYGGLVQSTNGLLYGTAYYGNSGFNGQNSSGFGSVYSISTNGQLVTLYSFTGGNDGGEPYAALALGNDGNFYGTTTLFGAGGFGTVFQITPQALLTTIVPFSYGMNGITPYGRLLPLSSGSFYGTASSAGAYGRGTVFRLDPASPVLTGANSSGGRFTFSWSALPGQMFQVQYRTNLATTLWFSLGQPIVATNTTVTVSDTWFSNRNCSYRVSVLP